MDKISSQIRSTAQAPGISRRARGAVKCRRTMFDVPSDMQRRMSRECTICRPFLTHSPPNDGIVARAKWSEVQYERRHCRCCQAGAAKSSVELLVDMIPIHWRVDL